MSWSMSAAVALPDETMLGIVREKRHFALFTHYNPDGDALGSLLGLADILEHAGKQVICYLEAPVPAIYRFLPGSGRIQTDMERVRDFLRSAGEDGACIALDCGDEKRLGLYSEEVLKYPSLLVIDHHHDNPGFGDCNWISPESSATGEMVFDLAQALGFFLSPQAAECLYAAISTDTGSFHYAATSSHTFTVAAELVRCGANPAILANKLYNNYTLGRLRLLQDVLSTLEMYEKERIAVIRVSQAMLERTFTTMEDIEHFINFPRAIHSVRVAVFLKERGPGHISVSLRAKGRCDVSAIAVHFGGGGHKNASGCTMRAEHMDEVRDALLPHLVAGIRSHKKV